MIRLGKLIDSLGLIALLYSEAQKLLVGEKNQHFLSSLVYHEYHGTRQHCNIKQF
jgi:hypothetical protein